MWAASAITSAPASSHVNWPDRAALPSVRCGAAPSMMATPPSISWAQTAANFDEEKYDLLARGSNTVHKQCSLLCMEYVYCS